MSSRQIDQLPKQIGLRIRTAREAIKLTQESFCRLVGFNDRQTIAAIEAGIRRVTPDELSRFMHVLDKDLDFFTDPFRLVGEARFSFRARGASNGLETFEEIAGSWIAFWRQQGQRQKITTSQFRRQLMLTSDSTFEDAQSAGEALVQEWQLGDIPSTRLAEKIEVVLGVLILYVDMPTGISGAACQVSGGDAILVNRREPEGRRNFDLAHELFHVLTWDALPPERVDRESPSGHKAKRVEQLADNFAGSLLMPRAILEPLWKMHLEKGIGLNEWLIAVTSKLRVSIPALICRLKVMGLLKNTDLPLPKEESSAHAAKSGPPPFSRLFMERAGQAIEQADVSVMRLIKLLNARGRRGLIEMFQAHGVSLPSGV